MKFEVNECWIAVIPIRLRAKKTRLVSAVLEALTTYCSPVGLHLKLVKRALEDHEFTPIEQCIVVEHLINEQ